MVDLAIDADTLVGDERLTLHYVRVQTVPLWGENPKRHHLGGIIESIETNGFRDPATWDSELGGVIEGNGRVTALRMMEDKAYLIPRGILKHKIEGYWCMPVLFGVDAKSRSAAESYAIDHNNLTLLGGEFSFYDVVKMWDQDAYAQVLQGLSDEGDMPVTVDYEDLNLLLSDSFDENDGRAIDPPTAPGASTAGGGDSGGGGGSGDRTNSGDGETSRGVVITIGIGNDIVANDAMVAIEELIAAHPEWEASANVKGFRRREYGD